MISKEECIARLYADEGYTHILKLAKDDTERKMIESTVNKFVETITNVLSPTLAEYHKNPTDFKKKLAEEIDPSLITVDSNKK